MILLRGPDGTLVTAASRRASDDAGEVVISRRIIDEVMGKAKPALVLDAALDDRFAGSDSIMIAGVRSVVAAPLIDAEGTLGLISVCSRASVRQFNEQDLDMLVSLASAAALRVRNVALVEAAADRRVMDHELEIAHEMQMAMLPRHLPERPEIAVAARLQPARSVGGDLYDFILDGHRLWFIVGDVAGKSVAAALYMAVAKTLFRAIAPGHTDAAEVAARMNRELSRDNERMVFVTALLGWLDITTGEVEIVDAGHNPAVALDARARALPLAIPKCVALGVVEAFVFTAGRVQLEAGAMLVLYTDGVTDARSTSGEMFGADRLDRAIARVAGLAPEALVQSIIETVNAFAAGAPPEDDLTLLVLQYRGNAATPVGFL